MEDHSETCKPERRQEELDIKKEKETEANGTSSWKPEKSEKIQHLQAILKSPI